MIAAYFIIVSFAIVAAIAADAESTKRRSAPITPRQTAPSASVARAEERERAKAEKMRLKREQAEADLPFYEIQLERLIQTAEDARYQYQRACEAVAHDLEMNRHGAIVRDKVVTAHIAERDRLLKKLITAENSIHAIERKAALAESILNE